MEISKFILKWKKLGFLYPYIWPRELKLQVYFFLSFFLLGLANLRSVYTLILKKDVVDSLTAKDNEKLEFRWDLICIYVLFEYLRNFDDFGDILWMKVGRNICKKLQIGIFTHIHSLSLRWHLNRKTGEIVKILDSSDDGLNQLLDLTYRSIIPTFIDFLVSVGFFMTYLDIWFGLTVVLCMICYVVLKIYATEWTSEHRQSEFESSYQTKNKSIDSLLNFETVKYFGNEKYEADTFKRVVDVLYDKELGGTIYYSLLYAAESFIISISLLVGSLLCGYRIVTTKDLTIGDYVMFSEHVYSIFGALRSATYLYESVHECMTDIERLCDFLKEEQEVKDAPNAEVIEVCKGSILFKNVFFEYRSNQPILKNVTFSVSPGETTAIVGPSGSGKSTIIRLLFRFYDVNSGSIIIDGQNVKDVTQESLRKGIGVVPQDTVLFNDTIRYNIKYGKLSADEEDIIEASKAADIHKDILTFKDGYDTEVGERGLRLSGGEKQRIAIARTILKAPQIVLLDEATSSLDTQTERNIQESLNKLCSNRTTIIVAHRLSTVIHADQILVLKEGVIVERGRHDDLLEMDGLYASMWRLQLTSNKENKNLENDL